MNRKVFVLVVMALLHAGLTIGQITITVPPTSWKDKGAKNTTQEIVNNDARLSALALADLGNAYAIKLAFEQRNKALVEISSDLLQQRNEIKRLIDKCADLASQQGSSYSVLSPAARARYLLQRTLLSRKIRKIKDLIDAYYETDNYMTEGERMLYTLKAARRALELVDIK
jgi:hypothetical protein